MAFGKASSNRGLERFAKVSGSGSAGGTRDRSQASEDDNSSSTFYVIAIAALAVIGLGSAVFGVYGGLPSTAEISAANGLYLMTAEQVNQILDKTALPKEVFGDNAETAKHWRGSATTSMWSLQGRDLQDRELQYLRLSATTIAEGNGIRVKYDVLPPETPVPMQVSQGVTATGPYRAYYLAGLEEQIQSKLTSRPFSKANISGAFLTLATSMPQMVRDATDAMDAEYSARNKNSRAR